MSDLSKNCVRIDGNLVFLQEAYSGHYILPIIDGFDKIKTNSVYFLGVHAEGKSCRQVLSKFHHQFGHPAVRRLKKLILDVKLWKTEYSVCIIYNFLQHYEP